MNGPNEPPSGQLELSLLRPELRFPFVREFRNYSWVRLRRDLMAGITLTLVSIPQAIGFALILNVPPTPVVVSMVIGGFVSALFFSSYHHVFGPTTSICLIAAATAVANSNLGLTPLQLFAYLAVLIGAIQFIAGLFHFGEVTKFISRSVVVGYTTGIGLLLVISQVGNCLGFTSHAGGNLVDTIIQTVKGVEASGISAWAVGITLLTLAIFEGVKRWRPNWPETLIGLALLGVAARIYAEFHPSVPFHLVKDEGALSAILPRLAGLPPWSEQWRVLPQLFDTAVAIAIIGMLEATAITKSLAAKSGQHLDANQELIGMGAGNLAAGMFGLTPGSSSFTRSVINYQCGATSQFSTMFSSVVMMGVLFFVTPVINYIPIAALAALLIRVGYKLISRRQIRMAVNSTRSDAVVFFTTVAVALFFRLETAIYAGIGIALVLFLRKTSTPTLAEYTFNDSGYLTELPNKTQRLHPQISIIHVEGELFFGAADLFQEQVRRQAEDENIRVFILRMKNARHLDATTVMALEALHDYLKKTGRSLIISGCTADVTRVLRNSGLLKEIGENNIFPAEANPTLSTRKALLRAQQLLPQKGEIRLFYPGRPEGTEPDKSVMDDYMI